MQKALEKNLLIKIIKVPYGNKLLQRERNIPAKEIISKSIALSHVPQLSKRELIWYGASILAKNVLKIHGDVPANIISLSMLSEMSTTLNYVILTL